MNNHQTRNMVFIVALVIVCVLCYQFGIKKTLSIKTEYKALIDEKMAFNNMQQQLNLLRQKERYYDSLLLKYQIANNSIQNSLLNTLNSFVKSNDLSISKFNEPHVNNNADGQKVVTYNFTVKGTYNNIMRLTHFIEQRTKLGQILNIHFVKHKDYKKGVNYLEAQILLQNRS